MNAEPDTDELVAAYQELCRSGHAPAPAAFAARYPQHEAELAELLPLVAELTAAATPLPSALMEVDCTDMVLGDYRLGKRLGCGGMGVVFEAEQLSLHRCVAVKILSPALLRDAAGAERFAQESRLIARLHHPNIVPVLSAGQAEGVCYYAMELISGSSMEHYSPDSPQDAARCALQAARALGYAHSCGVIHADVKPANLLRGADGTVYVADFGLATLQGNAAAGGTPRYMAPEQAGGATPACDQYALGLTLREWLTGHPHPNATPPPLPLRGKAADLCAVINRALQRDPSRRYADMAQMAADLEHYLNGEPVSPSTRRASAARALLLWARRKPALACAWGAAALAAVGFVTALGVGWVRTHTALQAAEHNAAVAEGALNRIFAHVAAQTPTEQGSALLKELRPYYQRLAGTHNLTPAQEKRTLQTLAACALRSGDAATAATAYGKLAELTRDPAYLSARARALLQQGQQEEARRVCRQLLQDFGDSAAAEHRYECACAAELTGDYAGAFRKVKALLREQPQHAAALYLYARLAAGHADDLADEAPLPDHEPADLLAELTASHPEVPDYGLTLTEFTTRRLSQSRSFSKEDWQQTDAAVGQAVQLAGRFPNTPSVVTSVVRLLRAYSRAQYRRGNEQAARRQSDRMLGILELLFYTPSTPDAVRETLIEMQLERLERQPAQGAAEVRRSVEQELHTYQGSRAAEFRRRLNELAVPQSSPQGF